MSDEIIVKAESTIGVIRINRPEKKNALTTQMYADMAAALEWMDEDAAIRVILLCGAGDFTAGNDLMDFMQASMKGASFEDLPVLRFLGRLRDCKKPVVAAVRGYAVGIGTTMLLHCDAVVAGDDARFRLPFVSLGLVPEAGSSLLLPLLVGRMRANWLLLSGDTFYADQALAMGLITKMVDDLTVDSTATEMAANLALLPPSALQETKRLLRAPTLAHVASVMEAEAQAFSARLASEEFREAAMKLMQRA